MWKSKDLTNNLNDHKTKGGTAFDGGRVHEDWGTLYALWIGLERLIFPLPILVALIHSLGKGLYMRPHSGICNDREYAMHAHCSLHRNQCRWDSATHSVYYSRQAKVDTLVAEWSLFEERTNLLLKIVFCKSNNLWTLLAWRCKTMKAAKGI